MLSIAIIIIIFELTCRMRVTQRTPLTVGSCLQSKSIHIQGHSTPSSYFFKRKEPNKTPFFCQSNQTAEQSERHNEVREDNNHSRYMAGTKSSKSKEKRQMITTQPQRDGEEVLEKMKFKRFSKILKQKYLFFNQKMELSCERVVHKKHSEGQSTGKCKKYKTLQNQMGRKLMKQKKIFVGVEKMPTKLLFKQRPSSGVPLKHRSQLLKTKRRTESDSSSISVDLKHIQALTYTDGLFSSHASKLNSPQKQKTSPLKRVLRTEGKRRNSLGSPLQDFACIEPWDYGERSKNVSELDIKVKLPH